MFFHEKGGKANACRSLSFSRLWCRLRAFETCFLFQAHQHPACHATPTEAVFPYDALREESKARVLFLAAHNSGKRERHLSRSRFPFFLFIFPLKDSCNAIPYSQGCPGWFLESRAIPMHTACTGAACFIVRDPPAEADPFLRYIFRRKSGCRSSWHNFPSSRKRNRRTSISR